MGVKKPARGGRPEGLASLPAGYPITGGQLPGKGHQGEAGGHAAHLLGGGANRLPASGIQRNTLLQPFFTSIHLPLPWQQDRGIFSMGGRFHPLSKCRDLVVAVRRAEQFRIHNNSGHTVDDGVRAG